MSLHDAGSGLSPKHLYAAVRTALQLSTAIYVVVSTQAVPPAPFWWALARA